jgi:hypothetical protein
MLVISGLYALSGLCFFLCMFTLKKDLNIVPREWHNSAPLSLRIMLTLLGLAGVYLAWTNQAGLGQLWFGIMMAVSAVITLAGVYFLAVYSRVRRAPA